jgi:membrane fusion protein (multidrug efflux system)
MNRLAVSLLIPLLAAAFGTAGCSKSEAPAADERKAGAGADTAPVTTDSGEAPPLPADVQGLEDLQKDPAAQPATPQTTVQEADGTTTQVQPGAPVGATGEFVSPTTSEVAVKLPGRVSRVLVDEGDRVRRGQPVLVLESDYLSLTLKRNDAEVSRARAAVNEAERDFKRKEELIAKGSVSQAAHDRSRSSYEAAQAALQAAEAARDLARQQLADATLRAPIDGVVAERRTDPGERLGDSSVALVIVQTSPLKLRFRVPERYLAAVREGQAVSASVDPYPGEAFTGRVTQVVRVVDPATRTVAVETEFANRDGRLYPGLFARVELTIPGAERGAERVAAKPAARQETPR